jgi:ribosomal protein S17E
VKVLEQGGKDEQPDLLVYPNDGEKKIAVEIETSANHPEQIIRNYEKNVKLNRFVIFIVPDKEVENKVRGYLKKAGKKYRIYQISY